MSELRVICLGCGDAFSERWYSSCLAVEHGATRLLIDCPHPIRKILRDAAETSGVALAAGSFSATVLTHLHADHSSGVEGWAYYHKYVLGARPILLAHPELWQPLWTNRLSGSMDPMGQAALADYLDMRPLDEHAAVEFPPFHVECRRTCHPIPTFALRIRAGGRTVGYSADTSYDQSLVDWLDQADLFIHETNHGIHTPYEALAALPAAVRSKMRLIHYPDDFDANRSNIAVLRQGDVVEV